MSQFNYENSYYANILQDKNVSFNSIIFYNNGVLAISRNSKSFVFLEIYDIIVKELFNKQKITVDWSKYIKKLLHQELYEINKIISKYLFMFEIFDTYYEYYENKYKSNVMDNVEYLDAFLTLNKINQKIKFIDSHYFLVAYYFYKHNIFTNYVINKSFKDALIFPGGHRCYSDNTVLDTLTRETLEEVGINIQSGDFDYRFSNTYYVEFVDTITCKMYKNIYVLVRVNPGIAIDFKKTQDTKKIKLINNIKIQTDTDLLSLLQKMFNNDIQVNKICKINISILDQKYKAQYHLCEKILDPNKNKPPDNF